MIASHFLRANWPRRFGEFSLQQLSHDRRLRLPAKHSMPDIPIVVVTIFAVSFDYNQISKARDPCHYHLLVVYEIPLDLKFSACLAEDESNRGTSFGPVDVSVRPTSQAGHIID